jgi:hypothetical protein
MADSEAEMPKSDLQGEEPKAEFWRDLQPIDHVFRPNAMPEIYHPARASSLLIWVRVRRP